jgi:hypothetical protein
MMEQDKEDSMEAMIPMMQTSSILAGQNLKPLPSKTAANYGSLLENDENYFEGILTAECLQNSSSISHQLASSSSKHTLAVKRTLPSPFWNESMGSSSSGKRFHGDLNSGSTGMDESNNSFVSLLNQLPQGTQFHPNALLGSLGDGVLRQHFQLPSMNWNS